MYIFSMLTKWNAVLDVEHTLPASRDLTDTEVAPSERGGKMRGGIE